MSVEIYLSSACLWNTKLADIIAFASRAGFAGVEVWTNQLHDRGCAIELRNQAHKLGLSIIAHAASWDLNLCAINGAIRELSVIETKRSISIARDMGATAITVHPGRCGAPVVKIAEYRKMLCNSLLEICKFAWQMDVTPSLELMEKIPKEFVINPEEINNLLESIAPVSCGITLDAAHLDSAEMFFEYFKAMPLVDKVHLSNRRGDKLHLPVFEGDIDTASVVRYLSVMDLPVVVEGNDMCREDLMSILRQIQKIKKYPQDECYSESTA